MEPELYPPKEPLPRAGIEVPAEAFILTPLPLAAPEKYRLMDRPGTGQEWAHVAEVELPFIMAH